VVKEKKETEDEVASSTTPQPNSKNAHRSHRGNLAAVGRRKGQADDAPLRRRPRAPIGASSRRVNAGAVRALSLSGIFGPDQGTSRPSCPFCIKIFTAPNLFAVSRLLRRHSSLRERRYRDPVSSSFHPCTPHVTLPIAPTQKPSILLPPDQHNAQLLLYLTVSTVNMGVPRAPFHITGSRGFLIKTFMLPPRQATAEFDWMPPCRNTRTAPFQILLAAEACI
jgi:hypothetical protein